MCGIFGYVGSQDPLPIVIAGLKKLEYRGYDSAGVAGLSEGSLEWCKSVGKIATLEEALEKKQLQLDLAIGHTRWATHGKPTQINALPHLDGEETIKQIEAFIADSLAKVSQKLL